MSVLISLVLPYPPSANIYWRNYRGHVVMSEDARVYKTAVGWQCQALQMAPHTGPVRLTLTFYRPAKRGDLDNGIKVTLDALNGHAYNDDSQIVEIHAYRREDKRNPRVEVDIVPMEG